MKNLSTNLKTNVGILIKGLFLAAIVAFTTASAHAQCPSCDKFAETAIYDYLKIDRKTDTHQDFQSYFFSDEFEKTWRSNKGSVGITVPFEGIPITFGGDSESSGAWVTRSQYRYSNKWQFDKSFVESIMIKSAPKEAREVWLRCIESCDQTASKDIRVSTDVIYSTVSSKIWCIIRNDVPIPKVVEFVSSPGLDCNQANTKFRGRELSSEGFVALFSWISDDVTEGFITLNTTRGAFTTKVSRPPRIEDRVKLTYEVDNPPTMIFAGKTETTFSIPSRGDVRWISGDASPDWKWQAWRGQGTLSVGQNTQNELRNAHCECVAGPCPWTQILFGQDSGKSVTWIAKGWSNSTLWRISGDLYTPTYSTSTVDKDVYKSGNSFLISIPKGVGAKNPIVYATVNRVLVSFSLGQNADHLQLTNTTDNGVELIYNYSIK